MVSMLRTERFWQISLLALVMGLAPFGRAQDAPEPSASQPQADNPSVTAAPDNSALSSQVDQLRAEVDQLKQQVAYLNGLVEQLQEGRAPVEKSPGKRPVSSKGAASPKKKTASAAAVTPPSIVPEVDDRAPMTVLVFHDGHRVEARNYAIVGQTLWIYTEQDSKKVPLADLDAAATKDANADRGITFQLPPTR
jgi:TolA-binding protein